MKNTNSRKPHILFNLTVLITHTSLLMRRFLPAVYEDGIESIRRSSTGQLLPSAREVSDYIHEERDVPLATVTLMLMQWGQFIDHDITGKCSARRIPRSRHHRRSLLSFRERDILYMYV